MSTVKAISASTSAKEEIQANPNESCPPSQLPRDAQSDYPEVAKIFAYGAMSPACDADCQDKELHESDDYVAQSMLEVAAFLSISAGKQESVAITVKHVEKGGEKNKMLKKSF